jgi:glycine C-acetyltransferase
MEPSFNARVEAELNEIRESGLWKEERKILSPQGPQIRVERGDVLCFCANNYLGLANDPRLVEAAVRGLKERGLGLSSVRFICGTQDLHKELEKKLAAFLGFEDSILYTSCFDANGGVFETLMKEEDAIISDSLNHASIIDGIRLSKAERLRWTHGNLDELETHLKATQSRRSRLVATDGVFSMDGDVADLRRICDLAEKYQAIVMVDDSHATGFFGKTGRGTPEHCGVAGRVDILTSTLGKALGGASGGFTCASKKVVDLLRQRSRPYLFSNTLPPSLVSASIACVDLLSKTSELRDRLEANTKYFREQMTAAGFAIRPGVHPIVPIMLGDAKVAQEMARRMLDEGIYVIGFSFPVVPRGAARIRVQISAAHTREHLDRAIAAFKKVGAEMVVLK